MQMKRLIPGLVFAGFFAAIIGTSFAAPAARPVTDSFSAYAGETSGVISPDNGYVIHVECSDYVIHVEWSGVAAPDLAPIATDALFDK